MPVKRPGTTFRTAGTPEPDLFDHVGEAFRGVSKEAVSFLRQGSNAERNGYKGDGDHQPDVHESRAGVGIVLLEVEKWGGCNASHGRSIR